MNALLRNSLAALSIVAFCASATKAQSFSSQPYFSPQPNGPACHTEGEKKTVPQRGTRPAAPAPSASARGVVDPNTLQGKDLEHYRIYLLMQEHPNLVEKYPQVHVFLKQKFESLGEQGGEPAVANSSEPPAAGQANPAAGQATPAAGQANPGQQVPARPTDATNVEPGAPPEVPSVPDTPDSPPAAPESAPPAAPPQSDPGPDAPDSAGPPVAENPDIGTGQFPEDLPSESLSSAPADADVPSILGGDSASEQGNVSILGSDSSDAPITKSVAPPASSNNGSLADIESALSKLSPSPKKSSDGSLDELLGSWQNVSVNDSGQETITRLDLGQDGNATLSIESGGTPVTIKRQFAIEEGNFNLKSDDSSLTLGKVVSASKDRVVLDRNGTELVFTRPTP